MLHHLIERHNKIWPVTNTKAAIIQLRRDMGPLLPTRRGRLEIMVENCFSKWQIPWGCLTSGELVWIGLSTP